MAAPTTWKLYNATELAAMISRSIKLLENAKKIVVQGENAAIASGKQGNDPSSSNQIGEVAFRDAGQLCLQAMQIIADTQGKELSTLGSDELDDLAANGFRWGNFAMLGCPKSFTHFSAATIQGDLAFFTTPLGSSDGYLTFTAISEDVRKDRSGMPDINPWASLTAGRVIELTKFPDLEGDTAWDGANNAFPTNAAGTGDQVTQGKIFEIDSKTTYDNNLSTAARGKTADTSLHDSLYEILKANEHCMRLDFDPNHCDKVTDAADRFAPVSNGYFLMREIATAIAAIDGSA